MHLLTGMVMKADSKGVSYFVAEIKRLSKRIGDLGGGRISEAQQLAIFMKGLPMPEFKPLLLHLQFDSTVTLKQAVDLARDFAITEGLETELGAITAPNSKKTIMRHQIAFHEKKVTSQKSCRYWNL